MGPQESVLTIVRDGDSFTGNNSGMLGDMPITDGTVDGDTLRWTMKITNPFPITLAARATVSGDVIEGMVDAGAMGTMPMNGKRKA